MKMDRLYQARDIVATAILERIRRDREQLPARLSDLLAYVEENLFDPKMNATRAKKAAKVRDHSLSTVFRAFTNTTLRVYIEIARLEVADRLLRRYPEFEVGWVSFAVGYSCHETFQRAYTKWTGDLPSEVGPKPGAPEIDFPTWRRAFRGELDPEASRHFLEQYLRLYPDAGKLVPREVESEAPDLRIEVDGERYARYRAEEVWRELRDLPPAAQRQRLRRYRFHSTALFDLLREKSREEGRRDRRRGIDLARLALVSLEDGEEIFGERVHDLRALGHAWLGNAYALAVDFTSAVAAFENAGRQWSLRRGFPGGGQGEECRDEHVLGEINFLKGSLRMFQRSYEEALGLVDRGRGLFRSAADTHGEIQCVIQRGSIQFYAQRLEDSIASLQQAEEILVQEDEPYLAFTVAGNLATCQAMAGRYAAASEALIEARSRYRELSHPLGLYELQHIDGFIHHRLGELQTAETLYLGARHGFIQANELISVAAITLELTILYAEKDRWPEVIEEASKAVPILQSLHLYPETLAAVVLLAQAVQAGEVSPRLLREVRSRVEHDPVARLSEEKRAGNFFPAL